LLEAGALACLIISLSKLEENRNIHSQTTIPSKPSNRMNWIQAAIHSAGDNRFRYYPDL